MGQGRFSLFQGMCLVGLCLSAPACGTAGNEQPPLAALPELPQQSDAAAIAPAVNPAPEVKALDWQSREALVVIPISLTRNRFEAPLDEAINMALAKRPDLGLDLVAVAPILNSPKDQDKVDAIARASAGEVLLALSRLGLGGDRVTSYEVKDPRAALPEIRLYPREAIP